MNLFLLLAVILLIILFALIILFLVFTFDSLILGHDLPTSKKAINHLAEIINHQQREAVKFFDLGCGRGTVVLALKKIIPQLDVCGIDNSPFRIWCGRTKARFLGRKVTFIEKDIFDIDLSNADVVYTYLWYDLMPILEKKLWSELKEGALVITNTSHFSNWKPVDKIKTFEKKSKLPDFETLFVYMK